MEVNDVNECMNLYLLCTGTTTIS